MRVRYCGDSIPNSRKALKASFPNWCVIPWEKEGPRPEALRQIPRSHRNACGSNRFPWLTDESDRSASASVFLPYSPRHRIHSPDHRKAGAHTARTEQHRPKRSNIIEVIFLLLPYWLSKIRSKDYWASGESCCRLFAFWYAVFSTALHCIVLFRQLKPSD